MHRLIMDEWGDEVVDHIDHDGLNNRRENLRVCSVEENNWNRQVIKRDKTSKYKGVSWDKKSRKFVSCVHHRRKKYVLGLFHNQIDAAKAYDKRAAELFGEFASFNFP